MQRPESPGERVARRPTSIAKGTVLLSDCSGPDAAETTTNGRGRFRVGLLVCFLSVSHIIPHLGCGYKCSWHNSHADGKRRAWSELVWITSHGECRGDVLLHQSLKALCHDGVRVGRVAALLAGMMVKKNMLVQEPGEVKWSRLERLLLF